MGPLSFFEGAGEVKARTRGIPIKKIGPLIPGTLLESFHVVQKLLGLGIWIDLFVIEIVFQYGPRVSKNQYACERPLFSHSPRNRTQDRAFERSTHNHKSNRCCIPEEENLNGVESCGHTIIGIGKD